MNNFCCCYNETDVELINQRRRSKLLDKQIKEWIAKYNKPYKILLLGEGESGKSTLVKQMKILHKDGFSDEERRKIIPDIKRNILDSIKVLIEALGMLDPSLEITSPSSLSSQEFILSIENAEGYKYPKEFFDHATILWRDETIQQCYKRSSEFQLIDSAKYFMEKMDEVSSDTYLPTNQDILHCRKVTTKIERMDFTVNVPLSKGGGELTFWMFDVGGQRDERTKWIQVFEGVDAILFVVASSSFDLKIREDKTTNRLYESLELFAQVWKNRFLRTVDIIMFLNKQDLLQEKIKSGISIMPFFPAYEIYDMKKRDGDSDDEYLKTRCFIRDTFREISMRATSHPQRNSYWHFTCAIDSNNIKRVFDDVHTQIILNNLEKVAKPF